MHHDTGSAIGVFSGGIFDLFNQMWWGMAIGMLFVGILAVGMKLYERGASAGPVMAFLLASPWNSLSLSLTLILIGLIGVGWTLLFVLLSLVIGVVTGAVFDLLVRRGQLPGNPWQVELGEERPLPELWREFRQSMNVTAGAPCSCCARALPGPGW
tara:strand:+ start:1827 stop:2294 length:468 start_codon:yes stop_codon:yes gene_type:complete